MRPSFKERKKKGRERRGKGVGRRMGGGKEERGREGRERKEKRRRGGRKEGPRGQQFGQLEFGLYLSLSLTRTLRLLASIFQPSFGR